MRQRPCVRVTVKGRLCSAQSVDQIFCWETVQCTVGRPNILLDVGFLWGGGGGGGGGGDNSVGSVLGWLSCVMQRRGLGPPLSLRLVGCLLA